MKVASIFITAIFFIIGFSSTWIESVMPYIKNSYHLSYLQVMSLDTAFFISYGLFSILFSLIAKKRGILRTIRYGLFLVITSYILIIFSFYVKDFYLLVVSQFLLGIGVVMLFVCIEFFTLFKDKVYSSNKLSFFQSIHSLGSLLAPIIIIYTINSSHGLSNLYLPLMLILAIASLVLMIKVDTNINGRLTKNTNLKYPHYILSIALALYVGVEITIGSFIMFFAVNVCNISHYSAGKYLSAYWLMILIGRVLGFLIINKRNQIRLISFISALAILLLILISISNNDGLSVIILVFFGVLNSVLFPIIYSSAFMINKSDKDIFLSGFMSSAIAGGGIISLIAGYVADHYGLFCINIVCMICYLFILISSIIVGQYINKNRHSYI